MKKAHLLLFILLLLFSACDEKKASAERVKEVAQEQKVKKVEEPKEKDLLQKLGIEINDQKIVIDLNKSSTFLNNIEKEMTAKANEIESKIDNADINMTEGMGIVVEGDTIGIDLNKTKNMFEEINVLMKDILLDNNCSKD